MVFVNSTEKKVQNASGSCEGRRVWSKNDKAMFSLVSDNTLLREKFSGFWLMLLIFVLVIGRLAVPLKERLGVPSSTFSATGVHHDFYSFLPAISHFRSESKSERVTWFIEWWEEDDNLGQNEDTYCRQWVDNKSVVSVKPHGRELAINALKIITNRVLRCYSASSRTRLLSRCRQKYTETWPDGRVPETGYL